MRSRQTVSNRYKLFIIVRIYTIIILLLVYTLSEDLYKYSSEALTQLTSILQSMVWIKIFQVVSEPFVEGVVRVVFNAKKTNISEN